MFYDSFIHKNCRISYAKGNDNLVVLCFNTLHSLPVKYICVYISLWEVIFMYVAFIEVWEHTGECFLLSSLGSCRHHALLHGMCLLLCSITKLLKTIYKSVMLGPPYQANVTPCASPSRCLFHHCPKWLGKDHRCQLPSSNNLRILCRTGVFTDSV